GLYIAVRFSILRTKYAIERDLLVGTFEDFFNARWYFFSSGSQGAYLHAFIRELEVTGSAFSSLATVAATAVQMAGSLVIPLWLSWQVTLVSFGVALLFALPFLILGRVMYRRGQESQSTGSRVSAMLTENLASAKVVLGFGNQARASGELRAAFDV